MGYIVAFVLGIIVATVGVSGVTKVLDQGVTGIQEVVKEVNKN